MLLHDIRDISSILWTFIVHQEIERICESERTSMCCDDWNRTHWYHEWEWEWSVVKTQGVLSSSLLYLCCLSMNEWFFLHFHQNTIEWSVVWSEWTRDNSHISNRYCQTISCHSFECCFSCSSDRIICLLIMNWTWSENNSWTDCKSEEFWVMNWPWVNQQWLDIQHLQSHTWSEVVWKLIITKCGVKTPISKWVSVELFFSPLEIEVAPSSPIWLLKEWKMMMNKII